MKGNICLNTDVALTSCLLQSNETGHAGPVPFCCPLLGDLTEAHIIANCQLHSACLCTGSSPGKKDRVRAAVVPTYPVLLSGWVPGRQLHGSTILEHWSLLNTQSGGKGISSTPSSSSHQSKAKPYHSSAHQASLMLLCPHQ